MGFYIGNIGDTLLSFLTLWLPLIIRITVLVLVIVFLVKGIKYLNKKNSEKNND